MPAKSPKQRRAAGMALAAKRGKSAGKAGGAVRSMMKMTEQQLRDYAMKPDKRTYKR